MKKIVYSCLVLFFIFISYTTSAQTVIWFEDFGTGCNQGQLAHNFTTTNGTWTVTNTGVNDAEANVWFISATERIDVDNCGIGCGGTNSRTLHLGSVAIPAFGYPADLGAAYNAGGLCGLFFCVATNKRVESPFINCTSQSNIELSFDYIEYGQGATDNATLWYYDGTTWSLLVDLPKTLCCDGVGGTSTCNNSLQGNFTNYTISLPISANNNPNVKIGFNWTNNDDGVGADPSFAVDNITLTVPSGVTPPVADFSASQTSICAGECIDFTDLSTNTPTSWSWTFTGGTPGTSNSQNPANICYTTPGTYTVTLVATNAGGSSPPETKTNYITVHPNPVVDLGPDTTICDGDILQLDAGAGYTGYAWLPSGSTQTINVTTTGTYSVTVTDVNTCQGSDEITVTVITSADATITSGTSFCSNDPAVNFTAVDGGGTWIGPGITAGGLFTPSTAGVGMHQIIYTIPGSCGDADTVQVTVLQAPTVNLGPDTTICDGDILQLDAGAGYTGYAWLPSGSTQTINVTTTGTYSVTVTDVNTCQGSDEITVTVITSADATITSGTSFCSNDPAVNFTAVDGGGTWIGPGITAGGLFTPSTAGVGMHQIIYTIPGSCGDADTVQVTVLQAPTVNLGPDTTICDGDILQLDAGAGYTGYAWLPSGSTQTINVTTSGTYSVTVTDANTCQGSDEIVVTVVTSYDATILTTGPFCSNGSSVQFNAQDAGGTWSGTGISSGGLFNPVVAGPGVHQIIYTITGSCGDADTVQVTVHPAPVIDLGPDQTVCEGDLVTLDAGSGYSNYSWTPSGSNQTLDVTTSGTYSVTVTDSNGCQGSDDVVINVQTQADASILTTGPYCTNSDEVQFTAQTTGGTWSGNGISSAGLFYPSTAGEGTHEIIYTIPGLCGDIDTVDIVVYASPSGMVITSDESCIGASDGWAYVVVNGGTAPYTIVWSTLVSGDTVTGLMPGTYFVNITDLNSCLYLEEFIILSGTQECSPPHVYVPNTFSPNGDGQNDILYVRGEGIRYMEFIIYSRWGEKVFESFDKETGWDGTYKGQLCDPGVFSYILNITWDNTAKEEKFSGNITLVR